MPGETPAIGGPRAGRPSSLPPAWQEWLEAQLQAAEAACATWGLETSRLRRALERLAAPEITAVPARVHLEDLVLALACAEGLPQAQAALARRFQGVMVHASRRFDASPAFAEEVRQSVLERLLLSADGAAPRISEYTGRGPLSAWVGSTAVRVAFNLRRGARPEVDLDERLASRLAVPLPDPELALIKGEYRQVFLESFRTALGLLGDRDVNVLRLHFAAGRSLDDIGRVYGVHRSSVSRWLVRAREQLFEHMRELLTQRLQMSPADFQSFLELVRSQLDLSLSRVLAP